MNRIENYKDILGFIADDNERLFTITNYIKDELTNIYGKYTRTFKGEFLFYVWDVEFKDELFSIYTTKEKGTSISIHAEENEDKSNVIKDFIIDLENKLKNE